MHLVIYPNKCFGQFYERSVPLFRKYNWYDTILLLRILFFLLTSLF